MRILVTFLHEISHGLAALATGGGIEKITVSPDGSGLCWTRGGWRFAVIPAGYLGSMFWGGLILLGAWRTRWDRALSMGLGLALIAVTLIWVRSWFGFASGLLLGGALAGAGRWLSEEANDFLLSFIGAACCLYALFDIRALMRSAGLCSDAARFSAEILPLPPSLWAALWALAALLWLAAILRLALAGRD